MCHVKYYWWFYFDAHRRGSNQDRVRSITEERVCFEYSEGVVVLAFSGLLILGCKKKMILLIVAMNERSDCIIND